MTESESSLKRAETESESTLQHFGIESEKPIKRSETTFESSSKRVKNKLESESPSNHVGTESPDSNLKRVGTDFSESSFKRVGTSASTSDSPSKPIMPDQKEMDDISNLIKLTEINPNPQTKISVKDVMEKIAPLINFFTAIFDFIAPYVSLVYGKFRKIYRRVPMDIFYACFGLLLAFFGGTFVLSLVVIETINNSSWDMIKYNAEKVFYDMKSLWKRYNEEHKAVERKESLIETNPQELARKVDFFLVNCKDPKRIMDMISGIGTAFLSVLAVLNSNFAKVISLGTSIGEAFKRPANYILVPTFAYLLPKKYHHWIYPAINYSCKTVAISLAMIFQRIISSIQSGIRGGLMFSRRTLKYLNYKGYYKFDSEKSYLDEIIGWTIALIGVYFQIRNKFALFFPFNLILFPLLILEWILERFIGA